MNIVLIGFKNSGKTSIGQLLAKQLNYQFIDTDFLIEKNYVNANATKLSVRDIYLQKGADYFRTLEKNAISSLKAAQNAIIATGGGCVLDENNMVELKQCGKIFYLFTPLADLLQRQQHSPVPAFVREEHLETDFSDLYQQRENLYALVADTKISTENKSLQKITDEILSTMGYV